MSERATDLVVGIICAVVTVLLLLRIGQSLLTGKVPLYRMRVSRADAGDARFFALIGLNGLTFVAMFVIAANLIFGLGLRGR